MQVDRQAKLEALRRIAMMLRPDGPMLVLFGFLAGAVDRLEFVKDLEGAAVGVQLSLDSRVWPRVPFRGHVDGQVILHPIAFVDLVAGRDDEVYVRVDFPWGHEPGWYGEVAADGVKSRRQRLEEAVASLRRRIDFALDVYRTARPLLDNSTEEERRRLQFVLQTARQEIQSLSRQLSELEAQLASQQETQAH
ncbi:MAG TPA: hypothetical protein VIK73_05705 [Limnochordales bacterium]